MKYIAAILNIPWTLIGLVTAVISIPTKVSFSKNHLAFIFNVQSFWWYTWLPGKKGARAMVNGHIVLLTPQILERDLEHELIHVEQFIRQPFIHPFLYTYQSWKYGYRQNKYEQEAYDRAGNKYIQ